MRVNKIELTKLLQQNTLSIINLVQKTLPYSEAQVWVVVFEDEETENTYHHYVNEKDELGIIRYLNDLKATKH